MEPKFQIYKSSAGSGKTTTLIKIFLELSLSTRNPSQFKKILAITFTNKAAAEMKERLITELDKIRKLGKDYSGDDFMVNDLIDATGLTIEKLSDRAAAMFKVVLHDFNDLAIGTIDQFNHRLIRSFSRELRLKSDFEVELQEDELFQEAVNRLIEKVGSDEFITRHLLNYVQYKLDEERKANIARDLTNLKSLVLGETGMEALEALAQIDHSDFDTIRKSLRQSMQEAIKSIQKPGFEALEIIKSAGLTALDFSGKKNSVGAFFEKIASFPEKEIKPGLAAVQKALEGNWTTKTAPGHIKQAVENCETDLYNTLTTCLATYAKYGPIYFRAEAIVKNIDLIAILEELANTLDVICEERNILPISKFNKLISNALRKEPVAFLYEHYGTRFHHILIDEYQDTSELQWFNILPLIDESLSKGQTSLVVGDAKQSIYRWRGGKAEQLISLPELIDPPEDLKESIVATLTRNAEIVELNSNFRSKPVIVDFNNALFTRLGAQVNPAESLYESEYRKDRVSQKFDAESAESGYVEVKFFGKDPEPAIRSDELINTIKKFKSQGYDYRDMAVLVRSSTTDGRHFLAAMQAADIPVSTSNSFEVDTDIHVQLIIAFLRLTVDNENPAAILTVMRCMESIFDIPFEPEEYLKPIGDSGYSKLTISSFLSKNNFANLKQIQQSKGVFDRIERLISMYLPGVSNRFLNGLLDIVVSQIGLNGSAFEFFEWWDNLKEKPSVPDRGGSDAVQLMTIHKSKGLQFKVVLVPHLNWKMRMVNNDLAWFDLRKFSDTPIPFAPLMLNSKLEKMDLAAEWEAEENANNFDNLNLIYVALTRAIDALWIGFEIKTKAYTGQWIIEALDHIIDNHFKNSSNFRLTEESEEMYTLKIGELPKNISPQDDTNQNGNIPWVEPNNKSWTEHVQLTPIKRNADQTRGILFHRLVALSETEADVEINLRRMGKSGELKQSEIEELRQMLNLLYSDPTFTQLRQNARIMAERDLFFNGEFMRPDLVFETDDKISIIDFKTGIEKPEHSTQVARYARAIRVISSKPVESFLLYTNEMRWQKVDENKNIQGNYFE